MTYQHTHTAQIALNLANRKQLPVISQWSILLANSVVTWSDRYKSRRKLDTMPDYLLRDVGITPKQAGKEALKPFWRA